MTNELDAKLCTDYPEIFRDRHAPMNKTAMCWGFSCDDGWYALIDELCAHLRHPLRTAETSYTNAQQGYANVQAGTETSTYRREKFTEAYVEECRQKVEEKRQRIPVAVQVKEKFGMLRFYVQNATDEQMQLISFAENLSSRICEKCGSMKDAVPGGNGWVKTLCPPCREGKSQSIGEPTEDSLWGV